MRFLFVFGLLGTVLTAMAMRQARQASGSGWIAFAFEAELAVCLYALSALYGLRSAGVRVEGLARRPGWSLVLRAILLPYVILGAISLYIARWVDREGLFNALAPGLFIGRLPFHSERSRLWQAGIDAVLNLCWEFPGPSRIDRERRLEVEWVPILDGAAPTDGQFEEAVRWVAARRDEGRCVLVHCAQGHGRTATVAAAILVRLGLAGDADQALSMIRAARPLARPSREQRVALIRYLARATAGPADRGRREDLLDSETHRGGGRAT
jgi:diacylglycerol kinase (ATP)